MKPNDKTTEIRQVAGEFELPPDPMAEWERPVAIVDPPSHIRDRWKPEPLRYEGKGILGRLNAALLNWMRRHAD